MATKTMLKAINECLRIYFWSCAAAMRDAGLSSRFCSFKTLYRALIRSRAASTLLRSSTSGGPSPIIRITNCSGACAKASANSSRVRIFFAVYFIYNLSAIGGEISVDRIRQNIAQHNDIRMLQINLIQNEEFEEMPEAKVG